MSVPGFHTVSIPCTSPYGLDFGVACQGALLEGSFQVYPAVQGSIADITCTLDERPHKGFLKVEGPFESYGSGHVWKVRVETPEPGTFVAIVRIKTETGTAHQWIRVRVHPLSANCRSILLCDSPLGFLSSQAIQRPLRLFARNLALGLNASDRLPDDLERFEVILLHGGGLDSLDSQEGLKINDYLTKGGRLIVLANHFLEGSITKVNRLSERHGILLKETEYDEVTCEPTDILLDCPSLQLDKLYWNRPSPIRVTGKAKLLVRNPERHEEGFVAQGEGQGNLIVIGVSLLDSLLCVGWPYGNGHLLAHILSARLA